MLPALPMLPTPPSVPAFASEGMGAALQDALPHLFKAAHGPDGMRSPAAALSPSELKARGVPAYR